MESIPPKPDSAPKLGGDSKPQAPLLDCFTLMLRQMDEDVTQEQTDALLKRLQDGGSTK